GLLEVLAAVDPSVAAAWQAHSTIGSLPLLRFGSDGQRERWLRPLAEGKALGAFGLTEPGAGSDVRSLRTRAERVSDEVVRGDLVDDAEREHQARAGPQAEPQRGFVVVRKVEHERVLEPE